MIIDCSGYVGSVPVSKLPHLVQETKKDIAENGLKAGIVGHVGDGMADFYLFLIFFSAVPLPSSSQVTSTPSSFSTTTKN